MSDCSFTQHIFQYPLKWLQCCLVVTWLVPRETAAVSLHVLCTPYSHYVPQTTVGTSADIMFHWWLWVLVLALCLSENCGYTDDSGYRCMHYVSLMHVLTVSPMTVGVQLQDNPRPGWWERFVGPGCAVDTSKFFVICSNNLGGCYGTSYVFPSSSFASRLVRFTVTCRCCICSQMLVLLLLASGYVSNNELLLQVKSKSNFLSQH